MSTDLSPLQPTKDSKPQPTGKVSSGEPVSLASKLDFMARAKAALNAKAAPSDVPSDKLHISDGAPFALNPRTMPKTIPAPAPTPAAPAEQLSYHEMLYKRFFGLMPTIVPEPVKPEAPKEAQTFRIDPELGRLAIVLHLSAQLRAWMVIREVVRNNFGSGKLDRQTVVDALDAQGIRYTDRHLRRLLASGEGIFWNVTRKHLYMRSWAHVASALTDQAQIASVGRIERNRPGVREMYIPVQGELEQWEAEVYAAWFAYRNNPIISRDELVVLFGRDKTTLRRWEKTHLQHKLTVVKNFAQCPDYKAFYSHIPQHAYAYVAYARQGSRRLKLQRIRWQICNTYKVAAIKQHYKKGQAAKVRRRVNMETVTLPAAERRGGWPRLYFDEAKTLKLFVDKHPDTEPRYVWRGENNRKAGIWEINRNGFPLTHQIERVHVLAEREFLMIQGRK